MTVNEMLELAAEEFGIVFGEWDPTETVEQEQDCKELADYFAKLAKEGLALQMEHDAKYDLPHVKIR